MPRARRRTVDPRDLPRYSLPEVARYLALTPSTLRAWVGSEKYIQPAQAEPLALSFNNLVEAHVLGAMRFQHGLTWRDVRAALEYVRQHLGVERPLLRKEFETDGVDLFVEHLGQLLAASRRGQLAWRRVLESALERIDRDPQGVPVRLFPGASSARAVAIDPDRAFGRPTLSGTGISTKAIATRYAAGEPVDELVDDYGLTEEQVRSAIRYESNPKAA